MIRLFSSKIYISIFTLVLLCILSFSYDAIYLYIAIFCAVLHEMGHIAFMKYYKVDISRISVYPFGVDICIDFKKTSYLQDAVISLSGTIVSFILSVISIICFRFFPGTEIFAFFISNFIFFVVNFLPVKGLDGGNALLSLLLIRYDFAKAYRIFSNISTLAFALLCLFAFYLVYVTRYNLSLLFVCLYLFISEYSRQKLTT